MRKTLRAAAALAVAALLVAHPAQAQQTFADVGKQPAITILVNSSPWYSGFEKTVELYEQQTGNKVKLDTTPYGGMLEKRATRSAREEPLRSGPISIPNGPSRFYEGGFLRR